MSALDLRSLPDRLADLLRERILAGEAAPDRPIRHRKIPVSLVERDSVALFDG